MIDVPKKKHRTLTEVCHEKIRDDIVHNVLKPGTKLLLSELNTRYEVGVGPLREALNRLSGEGLVIADGQRGFRVSAVSKEEIRDMCEVRVLLECEALKNSMANGDDEWEVNIVAAFHRLTMLEESQKIRDLPGWEHCNRAFHESLIAACDSLWLLRLRRILYDSLTRYRFLVVNSGGIRRDVHSEHEALKDAVIARDVSKACDTMQRHIIGNVDENRFLT